MSKKAATRPSGFSATETDRGPAKKFKLALNRVCQPGLRLRIIGDQLVLRAERHAVRDRLDRCSGCADVRLQKAQANDVAGKRKFNDRLVPLQTGLVDGNDAAFDQVKIGFWVPKAEQWVEGYADFETTTSATASSRSPSAFLVVLGLGRAAVAVRAMRPLPPDALRDPHALFLRGSWSNCCARSGKGGAVFGR